MAQVIVEMSADEARLYRAQQKIIQQQARMDQGYSKVGRSSKQMEATSRSATQNMAAGVGKVTSMLVGGGGLAVAAGLVSKAFQMMGEDADKALASFDKLADSRRRLIQVATSAEDLQQMISRADAAAQRFGVARDVAQRVMFSARSEGFEGSFERVVGANVAVNPEAAAGVEGQFRGLFPGMGPMQATNAVLKAAQQSRLAFEDIARAAPGAAEGAKLQGASAQETLAALSVLASEFKSGETAADRIKAFATKASLDQRTAGQGLLGAVETIQSMPEKDRKKFLGESQEMNVAFTKLADNMAMIRQRTQEVAEAMSFAETAQSPLQRSIAAATKEGTRVGQQVTADIQRQRAKMQREVATEQADFRRGASAEAVQDQIVAEMKARQAPVQEQLLTGIATGLARRTGMPGDVVGAAGTAARGVFQLNELMGGRAITEATQGLLFGADRPDRQLVEAAGDLRSAARDQRAAAQASRAAAARRDAAAGADQ